MNQGTYLMMLGEVERQTQETCTETCPSSGVSLVRNRGSGRTRPLRLDTFSAIFSANYDMTSDIIIKLYILHKNNHLTIELSQIKLKALVLKYLFTC